MVSDELVAQIEQVLRNILAVLAEAGGEAAHLTRLTWYLTDLDEYLAKQREIGAVWREVIGRTIRRWPRWRSPASWSPAPKWRSKRRR